MLRSFEVHLLPDELAGRDLRGSVAVVIDLLRASTTIIHALAAGARAVVPCGDVETARKLAAAFPAGEVLLGGERGGVRIEGFDLDNSPLAYTPETVAGKTIVFTTTNGTRALEKCRTADRVLIAGFVNLSAAVRALAADDRSAHLVCAGTRGEVSMDDVVCAGAIADALAAVDPNFDLSSIVTQRAIDDYRGCAHSPQALYDVVQTSPGCRDLLTLGFEADIHRSLERDRFEIVPEYDRETGEIR